MGAHHPGHQRGEFGGGSVNTYADTEDRFWRWADALLAGTGWTAATAHKAVSGSEADLAGAALADGFAAAERALAPDRDDVGGGVS